MNIYLTGDKHGYFYSITRYCQLHKNLNRNDDVMIILGDVGINYYEECILSGLYRTLTDLPITLLCVHGNHERRPATISSYEIDEFCNGKVYINPEFLHVKFAIDGEIYDLPDYTGNIKKCIVIGGAYSVDKYYRLANGISWFADEQPSDEIKINVENALIKNNWNIDYVFTHTCPYRFRPTEWFLDIDTSKMIIDTSTEEWLQTIYDRLKHFEKWYCGHFHGEKYDINAKIRFMYEDITKLGQN